MSRRNGPVWVSSGLHLAAPTADGRVRVTDDLLRAWLMRIELRPIPESCDAERALHAGLVEEPQRAVGEAELGQLEDEDARENYRLFLRFRDLLLGAGSVEAAYLALFRRSLPPIPPIFIEQMAHLIVANLFEAGLRDASAFHARAAELLFREQSATVEDGVLVVADSETVESHEGAEGAALFRMVEEAGTARRGVALDVLGEDPDIYWARADRFDTALDMRVGQDGQDALADVLAAWVGHMLGLRVRVQPVADITDSAWRWHVGLDARASALLDRLYAGEALSDAELHSIAGLYRLDFDDQSNMLEEARGRPVYLAMAMDERRRIRVKPQNLLVNLPIATGDGLASAGGSAKD